MTKPQFGHCKDCKAWFQYEDDSAGICRRFPVWDHKEVGQGCWSFIPKVEQSCKTCQMSKVSEVCGDCWRGLNIYGDYWAPKKETE